MELLIKSFPCSTRDYIANPTVREGEFLVYFPSRESTSFQCSYLANLIYGQFYSWSIWAGWQASLTQRILSVVFLRAAKQVRGTKAWWIIAGMQGINVWRKWAVSQFLCQSVNEYDFMPVLSGHLSVVIAVPTKRPFYTLLRIIGEVRQHFFEQQKGIGGFQVNRPDALRIATQTPYVVIGGDLPESQNESDAPSAACVEGAFDPFTSIPFNTGEILPRFRQIVGAARIYQFLKSLKVAKIAHWRSECPFHSAARPCTVVEAGVGPFLLYPEVG